ncbi:MAG: GNAT family N-acetyltransferase [Alphaproteobacteria bacterium]
MRQTDNPTIHTSVHPAMHPAPHGAVHECRIAWNTLSPPQWEERFARIKRSNILQSYAYAQAMCPRLSMRGRWGLIVIDGAEAGLVQILEADFARKAFHAITLDRAPLWFEGFGTIAHYEAFLSALLEEFPKRLGRRYRIIPNMQDDAALKALMTQKRFRSASGHYETLWLDLEQSEAALRSALKKNWRGVLSKAEQHSDIDIRWSFNPDDLQTLLLHYVTDKAQKGYNGASVKTIRALARVMLPQQKMLIGHALKDGQSVACVLLLLHGRSATYQIGWTGEDGRKLGAQNLLLWRAALTLKENGISDFDLGGTNDDTAQSVKQFKQGMGAQIVVTGGVYR